MTDLRQWQLPVGVSTAVNRKGEVVRVHAVGKGGYSITWRWEVSFTFRPRYLGERTPGTYLTGGLEYLKADLDVLKKRSVPRTFRPVAWAPYQVRYPDSQLHFYSEGHAVNINMLRGLFSDCASCLVRLSYFCACYGASTCVLLIMVHCIFETPCTRWRSWFRHCAASGRSRARFPMG